MKHKIDLQNELANAQLEIQNESLKYARREINDNIGQILSLAKLNLNAPSPSKINDTKDLISDAIQDIRSLSKTLNITENENISLVDLIEQEGYQWDKREQFITKFNYTDFNKELHPHQKIMLFRIYQECINNIIKHAEAKEIHIILSNNASDILLKISDAGKSFSPEKVKNVSGLTHIKKRIALLNGTLNIETTTNEGTTISIKIPILENQLNA